MRIPFPAAALLGSALCLPAPLRAARREAPAPCRLVTKAEAKALLGAPIVSAAEGERIEGDPNRMCSYRAANGRILNVYVGAKKRAEFEAEKTGRRTIAGVGDDAYLNPPNIITLRKGSRGASVQAMGFDAARDAALLPKLKALARALARRL